MPGGLAWLARVLAYVYIVFYGALDVLAGIGTGLLSQQGAGAAPIRTLFGAGDTLASVGVWAFPLASVLTSGVLFRQCGPYVWPGATLLILSAVSYLDSHIYAPCRVSSVLDMGAGMALLEGQRSWPAPRPDPVRREQSPTSSA
ncbi:hypothetical protein [Deinococcus sp.]|uniref:hypothetical protein n=1 Tax=Deinococcus sp. TaxID=47478 RepID=UPI002869B23F|nr:hypothetical protein [Deinococcus sp.]